MFINYGLPAEKLGLKPTDEISIIFISVGKAVNMGVLSDEKIVSITYSLNLSPKVHTDVFQGRFHSKQNMIPSFSMSDNLG